MAKVKVPAKHVDDQEVSAVTAVASTGAAVTAKCLLIIDSGSNDLTIKNAANDAAIKGYSTWDVSAETTVLCKWFSDGTNGYWYGVGGAN